MRFKYIYKYTHRIEKTDAGNTGPTASNTAHDEHGASNSQGHAGYDKSQVSIIVEGRHLQIAEDFWIYQEPDPEPDQHNAT